MLPFVQHTSTLVLLQSQVSKEYDLLPPHNVVAHLTTRTRTTLTTRTKHQNESTQKHKLFHVQLHGRRRPAAEVVRVRCGGVGVPNTRCIGLWRRSEELPSTEARTGGRLLLRPRRRRPQRRARGGHESPGAGFMAPMISTLSSGRAVRGGRSVRGAASCGCLVRGRSSMTRSTTRGVKQRRREAGSSVWRLGSGARQI